MNKLKNKYKLKFIIKQNKLPFISKNIPFILFYNHFIWKIITIVREIYTVLIRFENIYILNKQKKKEISK